MCLLVRCDVTKCIELKINAHVFMTDIPGSETDKEYTPPDTTKMRSGLLSEISGTIMYGIFNLYKFFFPRSLSQFWVDPPFRLSKLNHLFFCQ